MLQPHRNTVHFSFSVKPQAAVSASRSRLRSCDDSCLIRVTKTRAGRSSGSPVMISIARRHDPSGEMR